MRATGLPTAQRLLGTADDVEEVAEPVAEAAPARPAPRPRPGLAGRRAHQVLDGVEGDPGHDEVVGDDRQRLVGDALQLGVATVEREHRGAELAGVPRPLEQALRRGLLRDDEHRLAAARRLEPLRGSPTGAAGASSGTCHRTRVGSQLGDAGDAGLVGEVGREVPGLLVGSPDHEQPAAVSWCDGASSGRRSGCGRPRRSSRAARAARRPAGRPWPHRAGRGIGLGGSEDERSRACRPARPARRRPSSSSACSAGRASRAAASPYASRPSANASCSGRGTPSRAAAIAAEVGHGVTGASQRRLRRVPPTSSSSPCPWEGHRELLASLGGRSSPARSSSTASTRSASTSRAPTRWRSPRARRRSRPRRCSRGPASSVRSTTSVPSCCSTSSVDVVRHRRARRRRRP